MSEEQQKPKSFMQELDQWIEVTILQPLFDEARDYDDEHTIHWDTTVEGVRKAIHEKVLESYRNGLKAGQKPAHAPARQFAGPQRR